MHTYTFIITHVVHVCMIKRCVSVVVAISKLRLTSFSNRVVNDIVGKKNTHTYKYISALEFRRLQQFFSDIKMANKFYASHGDKEPNKYTDNIITSARSLMLLLLFFCCYSATHIQANRRRRVRLYREANKDLSVQLNWYNFLVFILLLPLSL